MKFKFEIEAAEDNQNFSLPLAVASDGQTLVMALYHVGEYDINYDPLVEWNIVHVEDKCVLELQTIYKWHAGLLFSKTTSLKNGLLTRSEALEMEKQFLQDLVDKGYFVKDQNKLIWTLEPTLICNSRL